MASLSIGRTPDGTIALPGIFRKPRQAWLFRLRRERTRRPRKRKRKFDNVGITSHIGSLFDIYPEWAEVPPVPCPVAAGGALFHNGLTFHGAGANMTPGRRRAMTCAYMPDGAVFNGTRNVLPPDYLTTLTIGQVLDDDAQNPLVYSRRHPRPDPSVLACCGHQVFP